MLLKPRLRTIRQTKEAKVRVRELMTEGVVAITPQASLREAASVLVEHGVSGLPVVDEAGAVVGVLSETGVVLKAGGGTERSGFLTWLFDGDFSERRSRPRQPDGRCRHPQSRSHRAGRSTTRRAS
jgi:CBS domain